jgi:hypothetical protein
MINDRNLIEPCFYIFKNSQWNKKNVLPGLRTNNHHNTSRETREDAPREFDLGGSNFDLTYRQEWEDSLDNNVGIVDISPSSPPDRALSALSYGLKPNCTLSQMRHGHMPISCAHTIGNSNTHLSQVL